MKNPAQTAVVTPAQTIGTQVRRVVASAPVSVFLGVVGLALLSQIVVPLPFTPVPVSMGTLGAMLLGVFLGPWRGGAAAIVYAIAGAAGLPILAGFASGYLLTSFGYVLGYIAAAVLVGAWVQWAKSTSYVMGIAVALAGSALVYVFGVTWMIAVFGVDFSTAIALGVMPFLLGDVLKSLVIAGVIRGRK